MCPDVPRGIPERTAGGPEVHPGKTESGKTLTHGLIWVRMGFTLQEKRNKARRHATFDPILLRGKKGELGERKPRIFGVGRQITHRDMGAIWISI
jgi:hypothetical protein